MNKSELVDNIAEGAGLSKADAERALNAFIDVGAGRGRERRQGHAPRFRFLLPLIARGTHGSQPAHG